MSFVGLNAFYYLDFVLHVFMCNGESDGWFVDESKAGTSLYPDCYIDNQVSVLA